MISTSVADATIGPSQASAGDDDEFRDAARRWIAAHLPEDWRNRSFGATDEALSQQRRGFGALLGESGWLTVNWPVWAGGLGQSAERRIAVLEELVAAGAPEPMNANALGIFAPTLIKFGSKEQCQRFLPDMVSHRAIWCQGFSEPGAGSDLAGISTKAEVVGDELVITGQKIWTSYAQLAEYCYLLVRTERSKKRHDGLTLVVLPMDQPGVEVRPLRNMVGTAEFCEVFLDGARAPIANVVGEMGKGWAMAMFALGQERSVGLAQRSLKLSGEFKRLVALAGSERHQGNPRVSSQFFETDLVDAFVRAFVTSATVRRAIELDSRGHDVTALASVAKVFWSESHQIQIELAARLLGPGFVTGDDPGQDWCLAAMFARAETIYGGTSQIQRNVLARAIGLPRGK